MTLSKLLSVYASFTHPSKLGQGCSLPLVFCDLDRLLGTPDRGEVDCHDVSALKQSQENNAVHGHYNKSCYTTTIMLFVFTMQSTHQWNFCVSLGLEVRAAAEKLTTLPHLYSVDCIGQCFPQLCDSYPPVITV